MAQACLSECAYPFRQQQPPHLQKHIWHLAWLGIESDEAAAVRAAAAKCLGSLAEGPSIQGSFEGKCPEMFPLPNQLVTGASHNHADRLAR